MFIVILSSRPVRSWRQKQKERERERETAALGQRESETCLTVVVLSHAIARAVGSEPRETA